MKACYLQLFLISLFGFSCADRAIKTVPPAFNSIRIKTGKGPASVEAADFTKDGFADIALADAEDSAVTILLGNGKGEFTDAPGSPFFANMWPNDLSVADMNKDGNPDLCIANTDTSFLTVLAGNGKGQFQQATNSPFRVKSKPHTHGIAVSDFNGDGNLDLASDSWGSDEILVIFGDGKGNFSAQTNYKVGKGNNATVLLNTGEGKFREAPGSPFPAGDAPFGIAIGDINADGNADLAIVNAPTITSESKGKDGLAVLSGDGAGNFSPLKGSPFATGKSPSRLAIGDLDGNGINDIAVTNYNDKSISIFYMDKAGLIKSNTLTVGNHPDGIAIHDMNNDGKNDIIVSNYDDNNIMILFQ